MARLPNRLVYELLDVAKILAQQKGRDNLRQAAMRRAISTAYYALFHALCYVCSDGLVRWSRSDLVGRTYRLLDHGLAKSRLESFAKANDAPPSIKKISAAFSGLKTKRAKADYETPQSLFNHRETLDEIDKAEEAIELIAALDEDVRRRLAIELLFPAVKRDT